LTRKGGFRCTMHMVLWSPVGAPAGVPGPRRNADECDAGWFAPVATRRRPIFGGFWPTSPRLAAFPRGVSPAPGADPSSPLGPWASHHHPAFGSLATLSSPPAPLPPPHPHRWRPVPAGPRPAPTHEMTSAAGSRPAPCPATFPGRHGATRYAIHNRCALAPRPFPDPKQVCSGGPNLRTSFVTRSDINYFLVITESRYSGLLNVTMATAIMTSPMTATIPRHRPIGTTQPPHVRPGDRACRAARGRPRWANTACLMGYTT
jgi:hypothetical protein